MRQTFILDSALIAATLAGIAAFWTPILWSLVALVPLLLIGLHDLLQRTHSIRRNFPLIGRGRWLMEGLRPYVRQYFVESDTDAAPINRMFRDIVYQRAKNALDTVPLGTRVDTYRDGYEWMGHSLSAVHVDTVAADLRVRIGGRQCRQPYDASILNISAMSFGALSRGAEPRRQGRRLPPQHGRRRSQRLPPGSRR